MSLSIPVAADIKLAESVVHSHISPAPLIRSYALEHKLRFGQVRRVWLKDYGWTPVGSFKVMGALNWMHANNERIGDRPVAAHSSGNFACGISYAAMKYGKRVIIVMPDSAPQVKFDMARSFGAEIRTYNSETDHLTGERDRITGEIADQEDAVQASPYDDPFVIAGNGVGGFEITDELQRMGRQMSHFLCQVSGGGLMAGHSLAIAERSPMTHVIGVEPDGADDFRQSLNSGERVSVERPHSICDGLLSYDVGKHNWPILKKCVHSTVAVPDPVTIAAMKWLYTAHGLRTEPSGAIATAAVLSGQVSVEGDGDLVIVVSGRNLDENQFRKWIAD